jgi:Tetracyclin repressor-like, C-terminal domain
VVDPIARLRTGVGAYVAWSVAHPVPAQIMFWRPVPGFVPSPDAYGPALETMEQLRTTVRAAVDSGRLVPAAATEEAIDVLTTITAGIVSQQLSNEPEVATRDDRFTRLTPDVLDRYLSGYAAGGIRA